MRLKRAIKFVLCTKKRNCFNNYVPKMVLKMFDRMLFTINLGYEIQHDLISKLLIESDWMGSIQAEMEGLTGHLKFGDYGRRENFTLNVVEMTVNSDIVKVRPPYHRINRSIEQFIQNPSFSDADWSVVGSRPLQNSSGQVHSASGRTRIRKEPDVHRHHLHGN